MNEANTKEANANPKAGVDVGHGLGLPYFAAPAFLNGMTEQSLARAKENCAKLNAASGAFNDVLSEAYSTNAKGIADYTAKVIEFSGANTDSALDFLRHLLGTKSPSELLQLSATHGRKNFETTTAQGRELWEIARKVASETAEPIKKGFAGAMQKAS